MDQALRVHLLLNLLDAKDLMGVGDNRYLKMGSYQDLVPEMIVSSLFDPYLM